MCFVYLMKKDLIQLVANLDKPFDLISLCGVIAV